MKSPSDSFLHAGLEARCMGTIQGAFKNVNSQATPGDSNSVGFGGAQEFLLLTNSLVSSAGHSNTERLPGGVKKQELTRPKFVFHL